MKLSKNTISVLKNFAGINAALLLKPGNGIQTVSTSGTTSASAEIEETFEQEFGIYDLNVFLGMVALFDSPDITFTEKVALIKEGGRSAKYYGAGGSLIKESRLVLPEDFPLVNVEFDLTAGSLVQLKKQASTLSSSDFSIVGDGEKIHIQIGDLKNPTSNNFENYIGETDREFRVNLKVEDLQFLPFDYRCSVRNKKVALFDCTTQVLRYWNAIGRDSTFGD